MNNAAISKPGVPLPYGLTYFQDGVNFAIPAKTDEPVKLLLFNSLTRELTDQYVLKKTGDVHHIFIEAIKVGTLYAYEVNGVSPLLDPYAKRIESGRKWNDHTISYTALGIIAPPEPYDWEGDTPPNLSKNELIIYEMHIRNFTNDPSSGVAHPGTFAGIREKIPYLKNLGINALEILPIFEFNEAENRNINPKTKQRLCNDWGYSTVNFFSPMNRYASGNEVIRELKDLIKELHKHKIEVILDVVYNHTGEGNEKGPTISFKGFDRNAYYFLDEQENYLNFSGCGNTFNCNHPMTRELILHSLRYWVSEFHIDGFRFDLASILTRGTDGSPLANPPVIEAITNDPVLSKVKLIAEAWDAAGLYQIGSFYPNGDKWSEWNGVFRDDVRRYIKGTHGTKGGFATRLCGSKDLYHRQSPAASINFITCHDGFTLADLVSYNYKHNYENGEDNQDGASFNDSWNCGIEGETSDQGVLELRSKQMRNFFVALFVSQGIPLIHMGDEYAHTKHGNNNTWCQDNELNYFLWEKLETNALFFNFFKFLLNYRKTHPHFRKSNFVTDQDIQWHGLQANRPNWNEQNNFLAFTLTEAESTIYVAFNATDQDVDVQLPEGKWSMVINTGNPPPEDFFEEPVPLNEKTIKMPSHSSIILEQ